MRLNFRHFGQGEPLIILHGLFGQSDNWVTVGKRLAEHFSVFIPDQRNHGMSPHSTVHTYPALSDDLADFMDQHDISKARVIGHSMGGKVAMTFALELPDRVEKLVIVDISPRKYPERNVHTQVITQMLSLNLDSLGSRTEAEKILEDRVPDPRIKMFILKNLYYQLPGKLAWRLNLEAINHSLPELFDGISAETQYRGPVLFIRGAASDYILDEDRPLIQKLFPHFSLETITGASHWVHADAPDELFHQLALFL
ncbi:MAG: alpha/beta fold hydrolase [Bacteroidetes bacterium]|nr:alpha/beta fold hydrolase [Bacteroidota bacterium]